MAAPAAQSAVEAEPAEREPDAGDDQESDDNEEYEVGAILDSRWRAVGGQWGLQYQVDWVGYPKDDAWYDAEGGCFDNCQVLVRDFHSNNPARPHRL